MKILHLMNWYMPGMIYQENYLPRHQQELGHDVLIVTGDRYDVKYRKSGQETVGVGATEDQGVRIVRLKTSLRPPGTSQRFFHHLASVVRSFDPDIVHAHGLWTLPTLQWLFTQSGQSRARLFVDDHIDNGNFQVAGVLKRVAFFSFRRFILPRLLDRVALFISVNPESEWVLTNMFGIAKQKVAFLPLGIDSDIFAKSIDARTSVRENYGLRENDVVFMTSGFIEPTKDIHILMRAFAQVCGTRAGAFLWLIGKSESTYKKQLDEIMVNNRITDKVKFIDWLEPRALAEHYAAGDVAVMPGKLGGIKDSIALGKPLITCRERAVEYLVSRGNGSLFHRGDVSDLSEKMVDYMEHPERIVREGRLSLSYIQDELSWRRIAERSIELYASTRTEST